MKNTHDLKANIQLIIGTMLVVCLFAVFIYSRRASPSKESIEAYRQGYDLSVANRDKEALTYFDIAIQISPTYKDAYDGRGSTLYKLKRYREALADFDASIEINPEAGTFLRKARTHYDTRNYRAAINDVAAADKFNPIGDLRSELNYMASLSYQELKNWSTAERFLNSIIESDEIYIVFHSFVTTRTLVRLCSKSPGTVFDHKRCGA